MDYRKIVDRRQPQTGRTTLLEARDVRGSKAKDHTHCPAANCFMRSFGAVMAVVYYTRTALVFDDGKGGQYVEEYDNDANTRLLVAAIDATGGVIPAAGVTLGLKPIRPSQLTGSRKARNARRPKTNAGAVAPGSRPTTVTGRIQTPLQLIGVRAGSHLRFDAPVPKAVKATRAAAGTAVQVSV